MEKHLSVADLDAADALAREATAGEWTADDRVRGEDVGTKVLLARDGSLIAFVYEGDDNASVQRGHGPRMAANAAFIAAARKGWPAALAEVRRLRAERDEQTEAKEAAYQMVGRLHERVFAYFCAACGVQAYAAIDSIDSGTTLTCEACGGKTVVDLDTPERRTARYAPAVAVVEERDRLRADLANMEAERDAALAAVEEARKERG